MVVDESHPQHMLQAQTGPFKLLSKILAYKVNAILTGTVILEVTDMFYFLLFSEIYGCRDLKVAICKNSYILNKSGQTFKHPTDRETITL